MAEWFKAHAWKVCLGQKPNVGSNPTPSACPACAHHAGGALDFQTACLFGVPVHSRAALSPAGIPARLDRVDRTTTVIRILTRCPVLHSSFLDTEAWADSVACMLI